MIHDLDLAMSLDSSACQVVDAQGGTVLSQTLDWANCKLQFASGTTANISVSRVAPQMTRSIKVFEAKRSLEANLQSGDLTVLKPSAEGSALDVQTKNCGKGDNLLLETEAYFHSVLGENKSVITGEDGLQALKLCEQVLQKVPKR
jgi:predicted dehydrogenase